MADEILRFNGQQVGTIHLRCEAASHLITPPARKVGLFQPIGDVNSDSRNLLYAFIFHVTVEQPTNIAAARAIAAVQSLSGLVGDVTLHQGSARLVLLPQYTIDEVSIPQLASGFGGRFAEDLAITVVGALAPQF